MPKKSNKKQYRSSGKSKAGKSKSGNRPDELRIIGGTLGGRKLKYSGDPRTRPMKERVREAIFNLLGPTVRGKYAIDLFAGTGALAFEAVSRGAVGATLIERHFPSARLIRETASVLEIDHITDVTPGNAFVWLRRFLTDELPPTKIIHTTPPRETPWVVFVSPPYTLYVEQIGHMLTMIGSLVDHAPAGSILVVECDHRFDLQLLPHSDHWRVRKYSPAVVATLDLPVPELDQPLAND